ncbi:MAG: hypothetical protein ABIU63_06540 [Chitinophagaceae bacterium]
MNIIKHIQHSGLTLLALFILFTSCNKLNTDPTPIAIPGNPSGSTLAQTLAATASDSLYNRLVIRSGVLTATPATITDAGQRYTMFVPDNNVMKAFINALSGGAVPIGSPDAVFSGFITANIPVASAAGIVSYNIVPQALPTSSFPTSFPNLQYPTILNPAPSLSALLRLTTFPSKRGAITWVNNVPLAAADAIASNGIIHHTAGIALPPTASLWSRISTDPDMTYFKAAVQRGDSGTAAASTLQAGLDNIGANLTVFVPSDSAMRAALTGLIAQGLIAQGVPAGIALAQAGALAATPAVFSNPLLYTALTPTLVKGIAVYHILGTRAFTVNLPTTAASFKTLLTSAVPTHPGVSIQATFTGPVVTAATVKGVANATPSIIFINSQSSSDQNATNGVLHKIDQVLLPQ